MSTGAGDGSLWQISQAIANCEAFYLQGNPGVDDLLAFSPVIPNTVSEAYPCTMGFYEYTSFKPYTLQGSPVGGAGPLQIRCHYFKRMLIVGSRSGDMETAIVPQMEQWVDYYANMVTAHQTLKEPAWAATHKILPNVIVVPTADNNHAYQNKTGATFTTGGVEPVWPTGSGSTVADGGGTWTEIRTPWGAVTNWAKITKAEVFSINTQEELSNMGIAFSIEATSRPPVTVGV